MSFLCNRETTVVSKSQPGFINFITIPLWSLIAEVMPGMKSFVDGAKDNLGKWETYEENDQDKQVYVKN